MQSGANVSGTHAASIFRIEDTVDACTLKRQPAGSCKTLLPLTSQHGASINCHVQDNTDIYLVGSIRLLNPSILTTFISSLLYRE